MPRDGYMVRGMLARMRPASPKHPIQAISRQQKAGAFAPAFMNQISNLRNEARELIQPTTSVPENQ